MPLLTMPRTTEPDTRSPRHYLADLLRWQWRTIVLGAWSAIRTGIGAVVDWLMVAVPAVVAFVKNAFLRYTPLGIIISHWGQIRAVIGAAVAWIRGAISWFGSLPGRFASWFGGVVSSVNTKVAAVVTYIRTSWGNRGEPVSARQANELRPATPN